jgi:hypothetical protein
MSQPRYSNYDNSNSGLTQFSDSWVDGAKYQQLRGTGSRSNEEFNNLYASSMGGADTGTVADDGDGTWKLIKQDKGEKTNERKLQYKDIAAQWQAAGYDVRVQDHNPDYEGGTGEIAVRIASPKQAEAEPKPVVLSDRAAQAKAYTAAYEDKFLPRQGDYTIRNDQSVLTDFNDQFKLNLAKERAPQQPAEPAALVEAEAQFDPQKAAAKNYSQNYKLAVGDMLNPSNR